MKRSPDGHSTTDPFFERMMDERIATLRAFLRMTTEKYQVPKPQTAKPQTSPDIQNSSDDTRPIASNVVELRRSR